VKHAKPAENGLETRELFDLSTFTVQHKRTVLHKRLPGRPKGPRGFVFLTCAAVRVLLVRVEEYLDRARRAATSALIARRLDGQRSSFGHLQAVVGRWSVLAAIACLLAVQLRTKGGVL